MSSQVTLTDIQSYEDSWPNLVVTFTRLSSLIERYFLMIEFLKVDPWKQL